MSRGSHPIFRLGFAVIVVFAATLHAQEFSADLVTTSNAKSDRAPTKIYVGKDKLRFEGSGSGQDMGGAMILDYANHKTYMLMPQRKIYMESVPGKGLQQQHMLFRTADVNNACPEFESWIAQTQKEPVTCRKIGPDIVNGRPAIKYEGTSAKRGTGYAWLDPRLHFVLKWQDKNGTGELQNIQEGPQAASLFEVPPDYQKFDAQEMMRQRHQKPQ